MPASPAHPFRLRLPGDGAGAPGPWDLHLLGGGAFGGGSHPTTVACLEVLASLAPLDGLAVLDLGSGSGILGMAALRLGAARATCLDVNPEAVASARRNGEASGLSARLDHRQGTVEVLEGATFDLVVANVGGELLLDLAGPVAALTRPGGRLLLSGLLAGWADDLAEAYRRRGCTTIERRSPGEFCALLLRRDA